MDDEKMEAEEAVALRIRAARTYCDQGHPAHDTANGCGPCRDERDALGVERVYA